MADVRLLVVDDASFIRDLVKRVIKSKLPAIEVEEAVNGKRALSLLGKVDFDIVLCDWEMPEMSGLEVLQWMRGQDRCKQVPFIMITSRIDKEYVIQAVQSGVTDYIGKPFSNEQLLNKVAKVLAKKHDLRALARRDDQPLQAAQGNPLQAQAIQPAKIQGVAADSVNVLTGGKSAGSGRKVAASNVPKGLAQLRLPDNATVRCVIKDISLQEATLVVKTEERVPKVLESAVVDIEQEGGKQVARVNGFVFSVQASERSASSEFISVKVVFVDNDPEKFEALSHFVAGLR
ncbi:two-component system response regulator [Pokkaliibacter plantistimulans]|uniref:Two-component system response regulator n=1 Tax=Proteobacteria bacterium 228 TaxID=2083153 RepID=A0A2S5KNV9_9PROT|nr:response regulator [Pokkaliibacter plantistimulans]PPC76219.1 two-component system response regulator [Pokkaliibacter plantistimulans]